MKNMLRILALITLLYSSLFSQTKTISLPECIDHALQQSYRLHSNSADIEAMLATQNSAHSTYYPHLFAVLSHDQLLFPDYAFRQQMATVLMDWSLGHWIKNTADIKASQVKALRAEREHSTIEVILRVARLFMGILRDQHELALLNERMRILNKHQQVAEALWRGGIRTQLDVLQTHNEIKSIEEKKVALQAETQNLQSELAHLLNLPADRIRDLRDFPESVMGIDTVFNTLAIKCNPLLQSLQLKSEAQKLQLREVSAENLPHLQVQGGYVLDNDPLADGNYWQAGIGLQIPIFRWGESKFRREEIKARVKSLQYKKAQAQRELEIHQLRIGKQLSTLRQIYLLQQEKLKITRQSLGIATANYQAGLITNLEYLHAQENNMVNTMGLNNTRITYVLCLIDSYALTNDLKKIMAL